MSVTEYEDLIPQDVASAVIEGLQHDSAALALGRSLTLPRGTLSIPVVSFMPQASFVNARGGRKPITKIEWSAEKIAPEEIACVAAIPQDFINDSGFPIWANAEPLIRQALAYALDMAVLWAEGAPASFPVGGVIAAAGEVIESTTTLAAISEAMGKVEDSLLVPNGHARGPGAGRYLRNLKDDNGNLVYVAGVTAGAPSTLFDVPVSVTQAWDHSQGDLITGDWSKLLLGIREDIRFDLSTEGVLTDDDGVVVANAFQDDLVLCRCYLRVGCAIGTPVNVKGEATHPFAVASLEPTKGESISNASKPSGGPAVAARRRKRA